MVVFGVIQPYQAIGGRYSEDKSLHKTSCYCDYTGCPRRQPIVIPKRQHEPVQKLSSTRKVEDCISMLLQKSNYDFYQVFSVLSPIQFDRTCSAFSASCLVDLSAKLNASNGHLLIKGNGSPRSCLQHTLAIVASQVPHPDAKILHILTPHSLADTCANSCAIDTIWALH